MKNHFYNPSIHSAAFLGYIPNNVHTLFKPLESETSAFLSSPPSSAHLEANLATTPVTAELVVSCKSGFHGVFLFERMGKQRLKSTVLNNHTPENQHDNGKTSSLKM